MNSSIIVLSFWKLKVNDLVQYSRGFIKMTITDYPNAQLLADAQWLNENLNDENLFIIDARTEGYDKGHISGAISLSPGKLADPNNEIEGFILKEDDFTAVLQSAGLNKNSKVLVYDDGEALKAARIFYALEYYGLKDQIRVLHGGYPAWSHTGYAVTTEVEEITPGNFVAIANENLISTREDIEENFHSDDVVILDVRSEAEYKGIDLRNNKKGGHIPGAVNLEWTEAIIKDENGLNQFRDYEDLKSKFEQIGVVKNKTIVPYCQTNGRGSNTYFTLRLLGYSDIRSYEGSWAEWGNAEGTEIEV